MWSASCPFMVTVMVLGMHLWEVVMVPVTMRRGGR